jgi:hypothetical protein
MAVTATFNEPKYRYHKWIIAPKPRTYAQIVALRGLCPTFFDLYKDK